MGIRRDSTYQSALADALKVAPGAHFDKRVLVLLAEPRDTSPADPRLTVDLRGRLIGAIERSALGTDRPAAGRFRCAARITTRYDAGEECWLFEIWLDPSPLP